MNESFKTFLAGTVILFIVASIMYLIINLIPSISISWLEAWGMLMILFTVKMGWDNYHGIMDAKADN